EEVTRKCLNRIESLEESVQAWVYLNRDYAIEQARKADHARVQGVPLGALHGVPVGVKDIIDTYDMPTEYGTVMYSGWQPSEDAAVVSLLMAANAVFGDLFEEYRENVYRTYVKTREFLEHLWSNQAEPSAAPDE
ncbi:MAG: hypothetical protein KKA48_10600, partial [Proteobacteria bacterium]|nr:hypothetical protein [Pseudomonadota bacterium]